MVPNTEKKGDSKEQLNLRVKKTTVTELTKQAKINNCQYRGNPSISKFLDKIGDRELVVLKNQYPAKSFLNIEGEEYCVNFQIKSQKYPGILAKISRVFSDWETDIIGLEAISQPEHEYFDIIALLPPNVEPKEILDTIEKLTVSDIWQYTERKGEPNLNDEEIKKEPLISESKCSISIEVVATSRIGLLADLTQTIALEGINVTCACRDINNNSLSISHFHLEWTTLEKTKIVIKKLSKVTSVSNVRQTEISEIIQRFQRLHNSSLT